MTTSGSSPEAVPPILEPLLTFVVVTALAAVLAALSASVSFIDENLHGLLAVLFLYAPVAASRISGRSFSFEAAGLVARPWRRTLAWAAGLGAVTWPLFFVAFLGFYGTLCDPHASPRLSDWATHLGAPCASWTGFGGAHLSAAPSPILSALTQLLVIAIPEELFFRGYLLQRFDERWPPRWRLWGAHIGWGLLLSSALFALGHFLVGFDARRFAVFVPGLAFAWLRARTGSVVPGALYHAGCNFLSDVLYRSFF